MIAQYLKSILLPETQQPPTPKGEATPQSTPVPPTAPTLENSSPPPALFKPQRPAGPPLTPLQRNINQLGFFLAGATFMAASVAVTRRAVIRRQRESIPRFFHASNDAAAAAVESNDRQLLAAQAFGLATLNVTSFGILLTGGLAWAFDLCSMDELKERTQTALYRPAGQGMMNEADEKEMEEMLESMMKKLGMDVTKEELAKEESISKK